MSLTVVMYHYVRDLARSRYPHIKGCSLADFRTQLDHLQSKYVIVTAEQVIAACENGYALPSNAAWLTFDDGYLDHYTNVFPLLFERGLQGSFFPPVSAVSDGVLLDVNKIHFILAAEPDSSAILDAIRDYVEARAGEGLSSYQTYWSELGHTSRFDTPEVGFIKGMLQFALPEINRARLADDLFAKFVSVDPKAFAAELYVSREQLRTMLKCGMYVGSHGNTHQWLDRLPPSAQADEIDRSLAFLGDVGARTDHWVMCYPYGAYNSGVIELLKKRSCAVALTTRVAIADIGIDPALEIPRLDTNDVPRGRAN